MTEEIWVKFNEAGEATWWGYPPIEGSEPIGDTPKELLLEFRRVRRLLPLPHYVWLPREKPKAPPPPQEPDSFAILAAKAEAEQAREEAINKVVAERSAYDMLLRSCNKITVAELNSRVSAIRAQVEQEM